MEKVERFLNKYFKAALDSKEYKLGLMRIKQNHENIGVRLNAGKLLKQYFKE